MSEGGGTGIGTGLPGTIEAIDELLGGSGIFGTQPGGVIPSTGPGAPVSEFDGQFFTPGGTQIFVTEPGSVTQAQIQQAIDAGLIVGSFGDPLAITQFPVDPPIAITQFPSEIQTFPATTPPTNVFDVFGGLFQGLSNQASSLLSLGLQFFGPSPQPIAVGAGAVGQPVGGSPVPIHAAIGGFLADTASVTLEALVAQAPEILGAVFGPTQPIISRMPGTLGQPGGPPLGGQLVSAPISMPGGARTAGFDLPFVDVVPQGAVCITPRATGSFRLPHRVDVPVPQRDGTMRFTTYLNMGRPVAFAGDFAAVKRVKKLASKARRRVGGR